MGQYCLCISVAFLTVKLVNPVANMNQSDKWNRAITDVRYLIGFVWFVMPCEGDPIRLTSLEQNLWSSPQVDNKAHTYTVRQVSVSIRLVTLFPLICRITECLRLEGTSRGRLVQMPVQAASSRAVCPGLCPDSLRISPMRETPQPHRAINSISLTL